MGVEAQTVEPVSCGDDGLDQRIQTEIAKQPFDMLVAGPDFLTDRLARGLTRQIQTALLIENRERRIDSEIEPVLAKQNAAEAMDGRNRSGGQEYNGLHPPDRFRVKRRADPVAHLGRRFLRKGHRQNAKRIRTRFQQLQVHVDKLSSLPRSRTRPNDGVFVQAHRHFRTTKTRTQRHKGTKPQRKAA